MTDRERLAEILGVDVNDAEGLRAAIEQALAPETPSPPRRERRRRTPPDAGVNIDAMTLEEREAAALREIEEYERWKMQKLTLDAIGEREGLSRERIRQIQRDALRKMRRLLEERGLALEDLLAKGQSPDYFSNLDRREKRRIL